VPQTSLPGAGHLEEAPPRDEPARDVYFPGHGFVATPIVHRDGLRGGERRAGPLVVESMDSTVVVPPGWNLAVQASGVLDLTREGGT
jgi:N-methylhydantoinase A/oxoprolinase/acetone carboxylase beta subunit